MYLVNDKLSKLWKCIFYMIFEALSKPWVSEGFVSLAPCWEPCT